MINTDALRNKILELAISGKLTERKPKDGSAEILYQLINDEKERLIKEGKIKKSACKLEIDESELLFEIPTNWKWVRFGSIITLQSGQDLKKTEYNGDAIGIPYLTGASNFDDNGNLIINRWTATPKNLAQQNDVLISCKGTVGKIAILRARQVHIARQFMAIKTYHVSADYIKIFMESVVARIKAASKGLIPGIERKDILELCFPLPPYAEQERISDKVRSLFELLTIIDDYQEKYINDSKLLKSKIIDAGISGELTEQLPEDGTAEELYQKIEEKRRELIKAKKLKKSKHLPEISEEEIPFDIPENWKWVYMGEIFDHNTGKALKKTDQEGTKLDYITTSNVYWEGIDLDNVKQMYFKDSELEKCTVKCGDLLICEGGDVGRSAIWPYKEEIRIQNHLHRLRGYLTEIDAKYYYYVMWHYKHNNLINGIGIGLQGFSSKRVHSLIVPLPPAEEQRRIVQRIEELLKALST